MTFPACLLTASLTEWAASWSAVEREYQLLLAVKWLLLRNCTLTVLLWPQLGGIPVPRLPWQPVPAGEGGIQALQ